MSTNATISVAQGGGNYKRIYVHWDGYPEHVGRILVEYYSSDERANALIALGDLSQLGESLECPPGHSFESPVPGCCVAYGRDRGEQGTDAVLSRSRYGKQEYNYVWDNGWMVNGAALVVGSDKIKAYTGG